MIRKVINIIMGIIMKKGTVYNGGNTIVTAPQIYFIKDNENFPTTGKANALYIKDQKIYIWIDSIFKEIGTTTVDWQTIEG